MESKIPLRLKLKFGNDTPDSSPCPPDENVEANSEDDQDMENLNEQDNDSQEDTQDDLQKCTQDDSTREKHKKSKKKKKKKEREKNKHKHHREKNEFDEEEPPLKKQAQHSTKSVNQVFKEFLEVLVDRLQNKDRQRFFVTAVSDNIAPGYSQIINDPMNFSIMQQKIQQESYSCLDEFKQDFFLICNNCMMYNKLDTVFYKTAKKLLESGMRILSPQRIIPLREHYQNFKILPKEMLGFDINGKLDSDAYVATRSPDSNKLSDDESDEFAKMDTPSPMDDLNVEDVLEQSQNAAREAAEKLTLKKPESTLGFLRQNKDGTTTLNFLTGCEGSSAPDSSKPLTLGLMTGKLTQGSSTLHNYREDKRTVAKPVKPLYYGTFSSFCPSYDSTFANLTKEESDMVYATYGNETAVQYSQSICDFSRDCDMAMHLVDQLLNLLTHQQHSRTKDVINERKRAQLMQYNASLAMAKHADDPFLFDEELKVDFNTLKSLDKDIGIDTSFLQTFEQLENTQKQISDQLNENASLLANLKNEQSSRLSKSVEENPSILPVPAFSELNMADKATGGILKVARQVNPGVIAPVPIVRKALGITSESHAESKT